MTGRFEGFGREIQVVGARGFLGRSILGQEDIMSTPVHSSERGRL